MRALQHHGGLMNRSEKAERARDKGDIVIDGFWDSHHRERVPPPLSLQKEFPGPALRTITANGEQDIDASVDQILHGSGLVHRPPRGAQNCAALQMNFIHHLVCENERFGAVFRIQPLISPTEAEYLFYAVGVLHFEKQRPDHIIESGTQSSAGNNARASFSWIEEQMFACARQFKEEAILPSPINSTKDRVGNAFRFIHPAL